VTDLRLPDGLRGEYPWEPKRLKLSCGFEMSYLDEGQGFPVVMVHGNPTWSFFYRNVVKKLGGDFRCIVPDHIGCGLSERPRGRYSYRLEQRLRDLGELIDALDLQSFDLVVHDWGGLIGLGAALERFERLRRATIMNTAAFVDSRIPKRIAVCRLPLLGRFIVKALNGFAGPAAKMSVSKRPLSPEAKRGFLHPYRSWSDREAVYRFVQDIPMRASHPSYQTLVGVEDNICKLREREVALLWGARDFCFSDHFLKRWQRFLPDATVFRYPLAGHYLLEDEKEKACEAIYQMTDYDD